MHGAGVMGLERGISRLGWRVPERTRRAVDQEWLPLEYAVRRLHTRVSGVLDLPSLDHCAAWMVGTGYSQEL